MIHTHLPTPLGGKTQGIINNLMLEFRQMVVNVQEEHNELKEKVRHNRGSRRTLLRSSVSTDSSSVPTIETLATTILNDARANTNSASPTDYPFIANTISSGTASSHLTNFTQSIRPPPYRSLNSQLVPQVPNRTRRRTSSNQLSSQSTTTTGMSSVSSISRGALIVLEGLDRVGKSTLASKLVEHLEKTKGHVTYCRFPDRMTPIGQLINEFLKSSSTKVDEHAMHLLFSANRWEMSKRIRHTLNQGTTVIVDRYAYSGIAYSSAKRDLTMEWCADTERGLPRPDLVIYLELPKEAQYQRPGFGDERFETREMQELVRQRYEQLMHITLEEWLRVDVNLKSPDQVLAEVIIPVRHCVESCTNKELGTLDFHFQ